MRGLKLWLAALLPGVLAAGAGHASDVTAAVQSGRLVGTAAAGVVSFKGVPYAAPPVGPRRWAPPAPAAAWSGPRAAKAFGAQCPQTASAGDAGVGSEPFDEDCLYLNVWKPLEGGSRLPVMVWVHGGGFINGSGSAPLYDGAELARRGVVVVTFNYRLGRLGFFAHPALTAAGGPLANYALMDQIAALAWVRRNARAFGGDPDNVTVFGESAGGWAINQLMLARSARGLFQRAIVQSGLGREQPRTLAEAEREGVEFVAVLSGRGATLAQLRAIPAQALIQPSPSIYRGFGPVIDGSIVTGGVLEGFEQGRQVAIPYLVGFNSREFPASLTGAKLDGLLPVLTEAQRGQAIFAYGGTAAFHEAFLSDVLFVEPAIALAQAQARRGAPSFLYQFDAAPDVVREKLGGAPHAAERAYVFGNLAGAAWPTGAVDHTLSDEMVSAWTDFAKAAAPQRRGGAPWLPVTTSTPMLMNFTTRGGEMKSVNTLPGYRFLHDLRSSTQGAQAKAAP